MPEKSLSEVLNQLRSERTACGEILTEMQSLKNGEFKEVFGQAFATAMLESERQAEAKNSECLNNYAQTNISNFQMRNYLAGGIKLGDSSDY